MYDIVTNALFYGGGGGDKYSRRYCIHARNTIIHINIVIGYLYYQLTVHYRWDNTVLLRRQNSIMGLQQGDNGIVGPHTEQQWVSSNAHAQRANNGNVTSQITSHIHNHAIASFSSLADDICIVNKTPLYILRRVHLNTPGTTFGTKSSKKCWQWISHVCMCANFRSTEGICYFAWV